MDTLASRGINKDAANIPVAMPGSVITKGNAAAFPGFVNGKNIIVFAVVFFLIYRLVK